MASDDKIEELIREIAVKHGIAVGRDDPILILQTINTRLMEDSQAAQQEILDRFKEELEAIAHRWGDDAKGKAERTLNAALAASKVAMAKGMQERGKAAAEAVRRELEAAAEDMQHELAHLRAAQSMSPIYGDAMQLAVAGYDPALIAERCGIARAEAELVVALAKSQAQ